MAQSSSVRGNNQWKINGCSLYEFTEAFFWKCSVKKVSLKISQNSQEKTPVPEPLFKSLQL